LKYSRVREIKNVFLRGHSLTNLLVEGKAKGVWVRDSAATTHYEADVQILIWGLNIQNENKLLY